MSQPPQEPACRELHRNDRPRAHIDQQQGQVGHQEDQRLHEVAPPEAKPSDENTAQQPAEETLFTDGTQHHADGRVCPVFGSVLLPVVTVREVMAR